MVSTLASGPSCPGLDSQHSPKNFIGKMINVAEVNQRHWLKESGQWLENVHRVLANGTPVLQKSNANLRFLTNAGEQDNYSSSVV